MNKYFFYTFIFFILIKLNTSYDFSTPSCSNSDVQQSPININYNETIYSETNYFRILSNNFKPITPDDKWTYFPNEYAIGVQAASDFGSILLVKDWAIYNFILKKVMFRLGTENTIENRFENAEMQLLFLQDTNYYSPGKRIFLDSNYLIISVPFRISTDPQQKVSRLFEFMNLKQYASSPKTQNFYGMLRNIKLKDFIVNQPAFMYKGTLTFPECQNALWMVLTQFHLISTSDLNNLKNAINTNINLTVDKPINTRDLKNKRTDTVIYRNYQDINALVMKNNLLNYNNSSFVNLNILFILILLAFLF